MTRPYLESLTTSELVRIADRFGIDIPPCLERIFIIEELLEIDSGEEEERGEGEADILESADFLDAVPLPKQYNITFIEVMIRDPLWAFLFWEIKGADKELFEKMPDFGGYCLRVNPVDKGGKVQKENSFTVPVGNDDSAWYLGFSPENFAENAALFAGTRYQVELCALQGLEAVVLAVSRPFTMPRLHLAAARGTIPVASVSSPLIRLSGVEDFRVIRNADRLSRAKYGRGRGGEPSAG
ncbi:DUF4912 domain-containing protein [Spirochaetia bacterium]|nr:DUF4912 domain-containing protein [Spirochaetia bacterium]